MSFFQGGDSICHPSLNLRVSRVSMSADGGLYFEIETARSGCSKEGESALAQHLAIPSGFTIDPSRSNPSQQEFVPLKPHFGTPYDKRKWDKAVEGDPYVSGEAVRRIRTVYEASTSKDIQAIMRMVKHEQAGEDFEGTSTLGGSGIITPATGAETPRTDSDMSGTIHQAFGMRNQSDWK